MKRSAVIPLLMLGTMSLTGCGDGGDKVETKQNRYSSVEDCRRDWGNDSRDCTPRSGGGYVGPHYFWNHSTGTPMAVGSDGSTRALSNSYLTRPGAVSSSIGSTSQSSIARGGFGSSARASSVGG